MSNVNNVAFGKPKVGGAVFSAKQGSKLPQDAISKLDGAFVSLGYISEDGLTNENTPDTETIKAWGGDTVLVVQNEKADTFTFKLIESIDLNVLKEVYGEKNVTGDIETGITVKANSNQLEIHSLVIDMVLRDTLKRVVIPNAQVSEIGEINYSDADAVGYELTINALPDENGNTHIEYIKKDSSLEASEEEDEEDDLA